jgi:hypothetical protein
MFFNCYDIITIEMPSSLTNTKDIVANSVSIINANDILNILDLKAGIIGTAPPILNTLEKLAQAINNGPQLDPTCATVNT